MNKSYKSVWNESRGTWVATSELTTSRGKRSKATAIASVAAALFVVGQGLVGSAQAETAHYAAGEGAVAGVEKLWVHPCQVGECANPWEFANPNYPAPPNVSSTAVGSSAAAQLGGVALGDHAAAEAGFGVALGAYSLASGSFATAVGTSAVASGRDTTAVGLNALASADRSIVLGSWGVASGVDSMALGHKTTATGTDSVALGGEATSSGPEAIAAGYQAASTADLATSLGSRATSSAYGATALGASAAANGGAATAVGVYAEASGVASVALGAGAVATSDNSVALGANSRTASAVGTAGTTIRGTEYTFAGANPTSTVSVGSVGNERTITNVAAGRLSATSTDAVNGSQLYATNQAIEQISQASNAGWNVSAQGQNATNVAPGGTVDLKNTDGNLAVSKSATGNDVNFDLARDLKVDSVTMGDTVVNNDGLTIKNGPSITTGGIDAGGRKIINVAAGVDAGDAVNKEQLDEVGKTASAGWNVSAQGQNATNVAPGGTVDLKNTDGNLAVSKSTTGNDVNFDLARDLKVDSVTMGDTVVNNDGLTIKNGPSITTGGIDAGGRKIINVAAGVDAGDAVNKEQLDEVGKTASAGWNVSAQGANATNVAPGGTVDLKNTDGNLAVSKSATGNDVNFDLARDLKVDSVTMGDTVVNNDGLTIKNGPSITTGGIDAGGRKIINVAAGVDAGDAVNKEQLDEVGKTASAGWNVSAQGANATNVAPGGTVDLKNTDGNLAVSKSTTGNDVNFDLARDLKVDSVTMGDTVVNNDGLTIKNGPSITTGGIDAGGRKIINVAAGVDAGDAVNKEQLDEVGKTASAGWNVSAQGQNATNVAPGGTVDLKNTDGNLAVSKSTTGNDVNFDLARDLKVDSVTMGDTVVNNDGLTIKNGPSITTGGIDAGGRKIINVAAGVDAGDAVNKEQLDEVGKTASAGWNVSAQVQNATNVAPGGTVDLKNTDGNLAVSKSATGSDVNFDLARDLKVDSVTMGDTVVNNDGLTIKNGPSITTGGIDAGGRKIINVAAGVDAGDAVNKEQLDEVGKTASAGWNVSAQGANATNVAPGGTVDLKNTDGNLAVSKSATGNDVNFDLARDLKVDSVTMGDTVVNNDGLTIKNGPSITTGGIDAGGRKIINVAAGVDAGDAVNKEQLDEVGKTASAGWNVSAQGQNATNVAPGGTVDLKNTDGNLAVSKSTTGNDVNFDLARDLKVDSVTMGDTVVNNDGLTIKNGPSITTGGIDAGGRKIINVAAGIDAGDAVNKEQLDEVGKTASAGWNVSAQGQNATNVAPGGTVDLKNTDGNLAVSKSTTGNDVNFDLARDLKVDSVTMGDTVVNNDGLTIKNGPSITTGGIDAGGRKIINVAAGIDAGDAVNKEQLDEVGKTASAGWNVSAQGQNATNVAPGGTVDLKNTDGNLAVSKSTTGNDVNFDLARDLKVDSVTMGDTVVNNDGLTIKNGPSITTGGIDAGGRKIINVAAGVDAGDAVNKEQLDEVGKTASAGWNVSAQGQNATNVAPGGTVDLKNTDGNLAVSKSATGSDVNFDLARDLKVDSVTMGDTVVNNDGLTIKNGPSITTGGIDAGGRTITNVAEGVNPGDAVNMAQLTETNTNVTNLGDQVTTIGDQVTSIGEQVTNVYENGTKYFHANSTGADSSALGEDSVAIGMGAVSNNANDVALGAGSTTAAAVGTSGATIGGTEYAFAGANPTSTVSVGSVGNERTITNVAAGRLSATSTDAVNGSQLYATNQQVDQLSEDIRNGAGSGTDPLAVHYDDSSKGAITLGDGINGTKVTNVAEGELSSTSTDAVNGSQLYATNQQVDQNTKSITNLGDQVTNVYEKGTKYFHANSTGADSLALGEDSVAIGMGAVSNNANDVALGAGSTTAAAVGTSGATIGGTAYAFAGATPTSTVSVGSVGNERTITNVAAGRLSATSTDAVNGSQLYATNQQVDQLSEDIRNGAGSGTDPLAVHYDDSSKGAITLGDGVNGTKVTNVAEGELSSTSRDAVNGSQLYATNQQVDQNTKSITNLGDQVTNVYEKGTKYFHANSTGADSSALGEDSVAIGMGAVSNNANDVALGAGSTTAAAVGTSGATIGGTEYAFAGANPTSTVSVGSVGNERTITNVAAGRLSATSTDAVNGSQLYATNQALDQIGSNITNLDHGAVKYDIDIDGTVNYNSVTLGGGRSSGPVVLTNVAAGSSTYDAVNYGQLQALQNEVTNVNSRVTNLENNGGSGGNGGSGSNPYFNATDTSSDDSAVVNVAAPGTGAGSTTAGSGAVATGDNGTAVGSNANASDSAVAIGSGAAASSGAVAVGQGAQATASSSVALGQDSVADRENTVSVGSAGRQRQVTNVAAGSQATDAVNVSQLTTVVDGLGGGASIDPTTGAVTGPSYQLSGGTYSNVGDALSGLDDRMNAADQAINDVARGAYSGIAAATALTMIPDVDKDKTLSIGIGGGTYKGYQAVAIGGTARITQNIKMKAGVGLSSGGTTVGVGASYQW
ncbi:autotransporter adhesin [Paraburkholderia atlantica]